MINEGSEREVISLLREIRDLLIPISEVYRPQYEVMHLEKIKAKTSEFEKILTPVRETIFLLLMDPNNMSQLDIAEKANTSQPTVSRFITQLVEKGLVYQSVDETGKTKLIDKYGLSMYLKKRLEEKNNG